MPVLRAERPRQPRPPESFPLSSLPPAWLLRPRLDAPSPQKAEKPGLGVRTGELGLFWGSSQTLRLFAMFSGSSPAARPGGEVRLKQPRSEAAEAAACAPGTGPAAGPLPAPIPCAPRPQHRREAAGSCASPSSCCHQLSLSLAKGPALSQKVGGKGSLQHTAPDSTAVAPRHPVRELHARSTVPVTWIRVSASFWCSV